MPVPDKIIAIPKKSDEWRLRYDWSKEVPDFKAGEQVFVIPCDGSWSAEERGGVRQAAGPPPRACWPEHRSRQQ